MINLEIIKTEVFRRPQRYVQNVENCWIGFHVSGLIRQRILLPDGSLLSDIEVDPGPHLFWRVPGMTIDFEYGRNRENWIVVFEMENLSYDPVEKALVIQFSGNRVILPFSQKIQPESVPALRRRFEEIDELWREKLPACQLSATLMLGDIFASAIKPESGMVIEQSPASKLKNLIDEDKNYKYDLAELCERAGYSRDYLRGCFEKRYRLLPSKYRESRRIDRIMDLIRG